MNGSPLEIINIPKKYIEETIVKAIEFNASDLHFEPFDGFLLITVHVDQFRIELGRIEKNIQTYTKEIKKYFGFKASLIGEIDDKWSSFPEFGYDFRGVIFPQSFGENITLRLLKRDRNFHLNNYSIPEQAKKDLLRSITKNEGLILVSGPTGSGKTTLLYSALGSIDRIQRRVLSTEDPKEYSLKYISQTQVDRDNKITFSNMLRAYMRAKPNVIMIGEIRDEETAEAAIHASNTGHLVLSTVHAANSERVFERLIDLKVKENILKENLIFSSAQRLIPKNCPHCIIEDHESNELIEELFQEKFLTYKSIGCHLCSGGYKGVELVFEYVKKNRKFEREFTKSETMFEQIKTLLKKGIINVAIADSLI